MFPTMFPNGNTKSADLVIVLLLPSLNHKYFLVNIDYLKNDLGTFYVSNIYQNGNKKCRKCRKSAD